jgi:hypothetical protein
MLGIPEHLTVQLKLEKESEREVFLTDTDGQCMKVPYVGPVKVAFQVRICFVGCRSPSTW